MESEPKPKRMIEVVSCDDCAFPVEEAELRLMTVLARRFDEATWPTPYICFHIPYLKSETVRKTVEYCRKHAAPVAGKDEDLESWDATFVDIPHAQILDLLVAGNHLGIQSLCDICCKKMVANTIKASENSEQQERPHIGSGEGEGEGEGKEAATRAFESKSI